MSARVASPAVQGSRVDPVRALQHALYRAAKADPGRRFHSLWDKVLRGDVLWRAWIAVRRNDGAPGIDKTILADAEEYGVVRLLDELAADLRSGAYRRFRCVGCLPRSPPVRGSAGHCRSRRFGIGSCRTL